MKKQLLFVIESLVCAGAEKSLVTLLRLLDYTKYEVDLQLFAYGGEFEELLPPEVNVLPSLSYFGYASQSLRALAKGCGKAEIRRALAGRLRYSAALRTGTYNNPQKAVLFWKSTQRCFAPTEKEYDVAIAYAQGTPTFYVADCVRAKRKLAWVNVTYKPEGKWRDYVAGKYAAFDAVNCVSNSAQETFCATFPEAAAKSTVIYDINDGAMMADMAQMENTAAADMPCGGVKILTVGRFAPQKGYDIALEACRILKERGVDFCWYALGRGALEAEIRQSMAEKDIEDRFVLLGVRANPYPYFKAADVYVQTSRFEGFGLAIAEARMLNTPVVTTRFDAVDAQMVDGENGLVVDMTAEAVADGIQRLLDDRALYDHITDYQSREKKGNCEEIEKFYRLLDKE